MRKRRRRRRQRQSRKKTNRGLATVSSSTHSQRLTLRGELRAIAIGNGFPVYLPGVASLAGDSEERSLRESYASLGVHIPLRHVPLRSPDVKSRSLRDSLYGYRRRVGSRTCPDDHLVIGSRALKKRKDNPYVRRHKAEFLCAWATGIVEFNPTADLLAYIRSQPGLAGLFQWAGGKLVPRRSGYLPLRIIRKLATLDLAKPGSVTTIFGHTFKELSQRPTLELELFEDKSTRFLLLKYKTVGELLAQLKLPPSKRQPPLRRFFRLHDHFAERSSYHQALGLARRPGSFVPACTL
jgi:hypothetical protein